jgi:AcrR family transcriptional regulator
MNVNPNSALASGEPRPQRYRSRLRAERAADTRERIAIAALELFTEHGFGGTTITAIAERAGVAHQTIYATFGTKAAILLALLARLEENAGASQWRDRIAAADNPAAKLEAFAHWSASMYATSKATITAAQGAVGDPAILQLRDEANGHRRQALTALIDTLANREALAAGLSRQQAVDRAWLLTSIELYLAAIDGCGWTDIDYARWLTNLLIHQLLAG